MKKIIGLLFLCVFMLPITVRASEIDVDRADILKNNGNVIIIIDPFTGDIAYANIAAQEFYGFDEQTLISMNIKDINMLTAEEVEAEMTAAAHEDRNYFEFVHMTAQGLRNVEVFSYPIEIDGHIYLFSTIFDVTDELAHQAEEERLRTVYLTTLVVILGIQVVIIVLLRITRHKNIILRNELIKLANYDTLTDLCNRTFFDQFLAKEISRAGRTSEPFTVAMFDIDQFKTINDTYGHPVGDLVLRDFANLLKRILRDEDIIARWGGDEFIVLFPHTHKQEAEAAIQRMISGNKGILHNEESLTYTFSVGVKEYHNEETFEDVINGVDKRLYKNKEN